MHEYEFTETSFGVIGTMPSGEQVEFATEKEYEEAYRDEENEFYDELADWYSDNVVEYPEDWQVYA